MARRGFNGVMMRGFGARDHQATVVDRELISPGFLRVRMTSPTVLDDVIIAPTAYLRFWFPDPDGDAEYQRGYTLTEADAETGAFAVDFVLHEPPGPATVWAQQAQPGDTVAVTSLGSVGFSVPDELPAGYLLIGDSASIPAINAILTALPAGVPVELYLEQHQDTDRLIPLAEHPRLRTHWVVRRSPASLAESIEDRDWSDWYAWAAPEAGSLKQLRTRLRDDFGFPKSEIHAQAYWTHADGGRSGAPAIASAPTAAVVR